jgi:hypothetical protein
VQYSPISPRAALWFFAGSLHVVEDYGEIADEVRNALFEALHLAVLKNWIEAIAHVCANAGSFLVRAGRRGAPPTPH